MPRVSADIEAGLLQFSKQGLLMSVEQTLSEGA